MRKSAAAKRYHEVERYIRSTCWKFHKRYGGELDELIADANLIFTTYAGIWDEWERRGRMKFRIAICNMLWRRMHYRGALRPARRAAKLKRHDLTEADVATEDRNDFDVHEWAKTLSADAAFVVQAVMEVPIELRSYLMMREKNTGLAFRSAVREYLKEMGWAASRIISSFKEIKEAL